MATVQAGHGAGQACLSEKLLDARYQGNLWSWTNPASSLCKRTVMMSSALAVGTESSYEPYMAFELRDRAGAST